MPVFRNVRPSQGRHSGRLENRVAIAYDDEGWEVSLGQHTLQDLCLAHNDSPLPQTQNSSTTAPPSFKSHPRARSSELESTQEVPALSLNGKPPHRRSRSDSAISASSSTDFATPSILPPQPLPAAAMSTTRKGRREAKPYDRPKTSKAHAKKENKIPRPPNAFIVFRSYFNSLPKEIRDGYKTNQNQVSIVAGKLWKSMSEEDQEPFKQKALVEKAEHSRRYPDYQYTPNGKTGSSASAPAAPKAQVSKRKARVLAAEYTDSEDEQGESYGTRSVAGPVALPARSLRPRANPRYIPSPSPSVRSASRTPSASSVCASSPSPSVSDAESDSEHEFVETEDIPVLTLSPAAVPEIEVKTPQLVPDMSLLAPALVRDMDETVFGVKPHFFYGAYNLWFSEFDELPFPYIPLPATPLSPLDMFPFQLEMDWDSMGAIPYIELPEADA